MSETCSLATTETTDLKSCLLNGRSLPSLFDDWASDICVVKSGCVISCSGMTGKLGCDISSSGRPIKPIDVRLGKLAPVEFMLLGPLWIFEGSCCVIMTEKKYFQSKSTYGA